MNNLAFNVTNLLIQKGLTVSASESCTGGLISYLLTQTPGSSKAFKGGFIVYSNEAKIKHLKVPSDVIDKYGAVSKETAKYMAINTRQSFKTDIAISVTGIAGPGGGTENKPVGTVFIALSCTKSLLCNHYLFTGNRDSLRNKSALNALMMISEYLSGCQ